MIRLLQSSWLAMGLGTGLYLLTTVLCWHPSTPVEMDVAHNQPKRLGPSWTFQNPEVDQLVMELKHEKDLLGEKEKQLSELALRLQSERQEINQLTQTVHELQVEFDRSVVRVEEQESPNLKKLARVYAGMAPENAVQILKQMDETTLAKIMTFMKDTEAASLLESMGKQNETEAKRAASISERLRLALPKPSSSPQANR